MAAAAMSTCTVCGGSGSYGIPGQRCEFCVMHALGKAYKGLILDEEARVLYEQRVAERGPRWDQIGEVTKSVWREYVLAGQLSDLA